MYSSSRVQQTRSQRFRREQEADLARISVLSHTSLHHFSHRVRLSSGTAYIHNGGRSALPGEKHKKTQQKMMWRNFFSFIFEKKWARIESDRSWMNQIYDHICGNRITLTADDFSELTGIYILLRPASPTDERVAGNEIHLDKWVRHAFSDFKSQKNASTMPNFRHISTRLFLCQKIRL